MKEDLIRCVSVSEELRVCQHLHFEEVGDRKRTQFLGIFRNLAVPAVHAYFRRTQWTNRLPLNTNATIVAQA